MKYVIFSVYIVETANSVEFFTDIDDARDFVSANCPADKQNISNFIIKGCNNSNWVLVE